MLFDADHDLLRDTIRRFATEEITPHLDRWRASRRIDAGLRHDLAALGVQGARVPEEFGGMGASFVQAGIMCEELARADGTLTLYLQLSAIVAEILADASPAVQERWLPALAAGDAVPCFALTEPNAGSDAAAITARAVRDGDQWVLNGEKASSSLAPEADICVLFARTGEGGARGISSFALPMDTPGVSVHAYDPAGETLTSRGSVFLDDARIPVDHLIGAEGGGFTHAMASFDFNRALIALSVIGMAAQAIDETITHVKNRSTFGKPLAARQGIAFPLAEWAARLEASRSLAYDVLAMADAGLPHTKEAAMVKWMAPKDAFDAIHACLLFHGWAGLEQNELPFVDRLMDAVAFEIGDGTAEIMKAVIARELTGIPAHR